MYCWGKVKEMLLEMFLKIVSLKQHLTHGRISEISIAINILRDAATFFFNYLFLNLNVWLL